MHPFILPVLSFILGIAASATAHPTISSWKPHEKRSHIPDIETFLYEASHPDSPNYGKHWSPGQIAVKFPPNTESIETVHAWLLDSGVESHRVKLSPTKRWLELTSTVKEAEYLLNAEYHVYDHETSKRHIACDSYHLPEHVVPHVDFRGQSTRVPVGQPWTSGPKTAGQVQDILDQLEDCLSTLYGLWYEPVATEKTAVEYAAQAYVQSDLDIFATNFSTGLEGASPTLVSIDGGKFSKPGFAHSNLDLDYGMALVGDIIEGQGGDDSSQDPTYPDDAEGGYKSKDCGAVQPANLIFTFYTSNEADISAAYAIRQCNEYAKLGLMGVTFLFGLGDHGVAGVGGYCFTANGSGTLNGTIFNPSFPTTCSYVTAVDSAAIYSMPDYQKAAVEWYLAAHPISYLKDICNSTGSRAFPDLSANGANYIIVLDGAFKPVYGTSASMPVVGAILTMVNDARIASKPPIGFIDPAIYSAGFAGGFNDVTNGTNPGRGTLGFNATQGWDPVTGLGTPNFLFYSASGLPCKLSPKDGLSIAL
ncbi:subtilisin-like protein [Rhizopogon salebrosus TDB-379]|nr:subtilisin-like protein [Rhizopogon salebrosus TDB-379]